MTVVERRRSWRKFAHLLLAAVIFAGLESVEALRKVEPTLTPLIAALRDSSHDKDVRLVLITDADLARSFRGATTLSPADLRGIIQAIAAYKPRILGIDFDTSPPEFKTLANAQNEFHVDIIWARTSTQSMVNSKLYVNPVLGGADQARSAVVALLNEDGAVQSRAYRQWYATDKGPICFLPTALMGVGCPSPDNPPPEPPPRYLVQYHGMTTPVVQLDDVMAGRAQELLGGKAVLLGGAYRGLDELKTPLGWQHGAEVLAQIAETAHGAKPELSHLSLALLAYGCAVFAALPFFTSLRLYGALAAGALIAAILTIAVQILFDSTEHSLSLLVTMALILGGKAYKRWREEKDRSDELRRSAEIKAAIEAQFQNQQPGVETGTLGS